MELGGGGWGEDGFGLELNVCVCGRVEGRIEGRSSYGGVGGVWLSNLFRLLDLYLGYIKIIVEVVKF